MKGASGPDDPDEDVDADDDASGVAGGGGGTCGGEGLTFRITSLPYGVRFVCVPTVVLSVFPGRDEKVANIDAVSNACVKGLNVACKGGG